MNHHDIVLNYSVKTIKPTSLCRSDSPCQSENTGAANNRHLTVVVQYRISSQNAQTAPIVLPICEDRVHSHQQTYLLLVRKCIESLGSTHHL